MKEEKPKPVVRKLTEAERLAVEERRIEINYLRHLKRKYPAEDERISAEIRTSRKIG
jgi:hypothetical protein